MTAASGMKAQQLQVDTIANNIANANTNGFKKSQLSFRSLLYQTLREPGAPTSGTQRDVTGLQVGSGTEVSGSAKLFSQGSLEETNRPLDMAIRGEGFFRIQLPNGDVRYTRNGSFRTDETGRVVTPEGYLLDPGPSIPQDTTSIIVGEDGTVSVLAGAGEVPTQVGNLTLFRFSNPAGLKAQGGNYFSETLSSGNAQQAIPGEQGAGTLIQGSLERSNVQTVDELVALIVAQRNYEVNSRAITVSDEMLQQVNQLIR